MYNKQEIIHRLQSMTNQNVPLSLSNLADYFLLENETMYREQINGLVKYAFLNFNIKYDPTLPDHIAHCDLIITGSEPIRIEIKLINGNWYFSKEIEKE